MINQINIFGDIDEMQYDKENDNYKIIMTEKRLQADIVRDFSQKRPEEKGLLWTTRNQTFSENDGYTQKAMGMVAGVSDLIYFNEWFVGFEIKAKGSTHSVNHIKKQLEWGEKISHNGGSWCIVTSLNGFWHVLNKGDDNHQDVYSTNRIREIIKGKKTINF